MKRHSRERSPSFRVACTWVWQPVYSLFVLGCDSYLVYNMTFLVFGEGHRCSPPRRPAGTRAGGTVPHGERGKEKEINGGEFIFLIGCSERDVIRGVIFFCCCFLSFFFARLGIRVFRTTMLRCCSDPPPPLTSSFPLLRHPLLLLLLPPPAPPPPLYPLAAPGVTPHKLLTPFCLLPLLRSSPPVLGPPPPLLPDLYYVPEPVQ